MNCPARLRLCGWLVYSCFGLAIPSAQAAAVPWAHPQFQYSTNGSPLAEVLAELGRDEQVSISLAPGLTGQIVGRFNLTPQHFLEMLARNYDLNWYYDGTTLHVTAAADTCSVAIRLNYADLDRLQEALTHTGLADTRFPVTYDSGSGLIYLKGPASYVDLLSGVAQRVDSAARAGVVTAVKIVKLHYATAADRPDQVDGAPSSIQGVAARAKLLLAGRAPALHGIDAEPVPLEYEAALPIIEADTRSNSILIRDRPGKLDADAQMVADLDKPSPMIAITTLVVDLDDADLASLPLLLKPAGPAYSTALLGQAGAELLARITELRRSHRVRIALERTMLTTDRVGVMADRFEGIAQVSENDPQSLWPPAFSLRVVPTLHDSAPAEIALRTDLDGGLAPLREAGAASDAAPGKPTPYVDTVVPSGDALVVAHPLGKVKLLSGDLTEPQAATRLAILVAYPLKAS